MGMQSTRPGGIVRKEDAAIAKNYLTESELQVLSRIVSLYIEYAELQALERKPMTMHDWITKLDEFLKLVALFARGARRLPRERHAAGVRTGRARSTAAQRPHRPPQSTRRMRP